MIVNNNNDNTPSPTPHPIRAGEEVQHSNFPPLAIPVPRSPRRDSADPALAQCRPPITYFQNLSNGPPIDRLFWDDFSDWVCVLGGEVVILFGGISGVWV